MYSMKGLTLQKRQVSLAEPCKSLICGSKKCEISFLFEQISQASCLHQGQKDPAVMKWYSQDKNKKAIFTLTGQTCNFSYLKAPFFTRSWYILESAGVIRVFIRWRAPLLPSLLPRIKQAFSMQTACIVKILRDSSLPLSLLMENVSAIAYNVNKCQCK